MQLQTQELNDVDNELRETLEARDQIERSIRNVTAEPFLRRDENENTLAMRITDLRHKLKEKDKEAQKQKELETSLLAQLQERTADVARLEGETN